MSDAARPFLTIVHGGLSEDSQPLLHLVGARAGNDPVILPICARRENRQLSQLERHVARAVDITSPEEALAALKRVQGGEAVWARVYCADPSQAVSRFEAMVSKSKEPGCAALVSASIGLVAELSFSSPGGDGILHGTVKRVPAA